MDTKTELSVIQETHTKAKLLAELSQLKALEKAHKMYGNVALIEHGELEIRELPIMIPPRGT